MTALRILGAIAGGFSWLMYAALVGAWCVLIAPFLLAALLVITFTNRFGAK